MKRRILFILLAALALCAVVFRSRIRDVYIEWSKPPVPSEQPRATTSVSVSVAVSPRASKTVSPVITTTPSNAVNLAVPFSSQAPAGDWSLPWQEACEETSAILVNAFWTSASPTASDIETEILKLVAWQQLNFGYYKHTTAAQTARMLRDVYGYRRVDVVYDVDADDVAEQVRAGRPVIVPLAGRLLGNPYYTQPGPVYHMLVAKGVAENGDIITNDVGTRHGRNLTYSPKVFSAAMHDVPAGGDEWPDGVDSVPYIASGRSAMIVVYPN